MTVLVYPAKKQDGKLDLLEEVRKSVIWVQRIRLSPELDRARERERERPGRYNEGNDEEN